MVHEVRQHLPAEFSRVTKTHYIFMSVFKRFTFLKLQIFKEMQINIFQIQSTFSNTRQQINGTSDHLQLQITALSSQVEIICTEKYHSLLMVILLNCWMYSEYQVVNSFRLQRCCTNLCKITLKLTPQARGGWGRKGGEGDPGRCS